MNYFDYDFIQTMTAVQRPNTVHTKNNGLYRYFCRYLLQKAVSVFKWSLPEEWSLNYFLYVLYTAGYAAVLDTEEYGVIPQWCTFNGFRTVYYEPQGIMVTNPAFKGSRTYERTLGIDAELIRLTPDFMGIWDIISYYADQMSLTAEALGINTLNTKSAYVFEAKNKAAAEAFKKMFDQMSYGEPAVFLDKNLFDEEGNPTWQSFESRLKDMYITPDLINTLAVLESQFDAFIGLPNTNGVEKKERLITDEVNMNNISTYARVELWKDMLDTSLEKVNRMFSLNIKCEWRHDMQNAGVPKDQKEPQPDDQEDDV